jgi:hypothetical protein
MGRFLATSMVEQGRTKDIPRHRNVTFETGAREKGAFEGSSFVNPIKSQSGRKALTARLALLHE